ncbi:Zinc finger protein [Rhizoctonia solani]|uniref:Zinc finger protein n=1 Tax=Rhizoctonia solani TaxID=456999 RepID=A0A8H7I6R8_9AGAM|nr:Zinc finger protein [Rhizoctonia solani]
MSGLSDIMSRFDKLAMDQKVAKCGRMHTTPAAAKFAALRREIAELKQVKVQSGAANPLLLCLIDGDGCIFNERLLVQGVDGGREAASTLRQHIASHYGGHADILVHIFFNREGLGSTVKKYLGITSAVFSAFISGFNTASPLMSMLDVGAGKEAADAKIRELMRIFVRFPHVKRVYFGGGHDNGYTSNLATLQTEGYLDKIVLLQGYTEVAAEIKTLPLERLENNGLFLTVKLSNKTALASGVIPPSTPPIIRTKSSAKSPAPVHSVPTLLKSPIKVPTGRNSKANVTALKLPLTLDVVPMTKILAVKPRACNLHYLTKKGCNMEECNYGHDYEFSKEMLADFRELVGQNPCLSVWSARTSNAHQHTDAHRGRTAAGTRRVHASLRLPECTIRHQLKTTNDEDDRVLLGPKISQLTALNKRAASNSSIDFPDYPAGSPNRRPSSRANNVLATHRAQVKNAFKNSVTGSTAKERLQQMGVGSGRSFSRGRFG